MSGTKAARAALTSRLSAEFLAGSKQSSPSPSQFTHAFMIAVRCFWQAFEPATSAATFCSSSTFQLDETLDVGVIGVDDHHLGGAPGGAAGLDRAGRPVADLQEAHQPRGFAAARKLLALAAQPRRNSSPCPSRI